MMGFGAGPTPYSSLPGVPTINALPGGVPYGPWGNLYRAAPGAEIPAVYYPGMTHSPGMRGALGTYSVENRTALGGFGERSVEARTALFGFGRRGRPMGNVARRVTLVDSLGNARRVTLVGLGQDKPLTDTQKIGAILLGTAVSAGIAAAFAMALGTKRPVRNAALLMGGITLGTGIVGMALTKKEAAEPTTPAAAIEEPAPAPAA